MKLGSGHIFPSILFFADGNCCSAPNRYKWAVIRDDVKRCTPADTGSDFRKCTSKNVPSGRAT